MHHLHPSQESGKQFFIEYHDKGEVVMLNLLKFKEIADYRGLELIQPETQVSGKEAYQLYIDFTLPYLKQAGSEFLFYGKSSNFLIGPESERWDAVLLIKHKSVEVFIEFADNQEYLKTAGHRTAALADSRLLPINELEKLT